MRTRGALTSQYICRAGVMRDGGREAMVSWRAGWPRQRDLKL